MSRLKLLVILALGGLGTSLYQTYHFFQIRGGVAGLKSFCTFGKFNCEVIEMSRYAEFFLGIPLSSFAAGWYAALLVVLWIAHDRFWNREAVRAAFLMTSFSLLMSLVYLYIMVGIIGSFCLLCLAIDAINLAMFGIVLSLKPECPKEFPPDKEKWKKFSWAIPSIVLGVVVVSLILKAEDPLTGTQKIEIIERIKTTPPIAVTVEPGDIVVGPEDAPIQLVKYSDFECPSCKMGAFAWHPLMEKYKGKIRFIYRNYPLDIACNPKIERPMHRYACEAAKIAICAHTEGKFEAIYKDFFENQDAIRLGKGKDLAVAAGLDLQKLEACIASDATAASLRASLDSGNQIGVESTPTFLINGKKVLGAYTTAIWDEVIRFLIEKK